MGQRVEMLRFTQINQLRHYVSWEVAGRNKSTNRVVELIY